MNDNLKSLIDYTTMVMQLNELLNYGYIDYATFKKVMEANNKYLDLLLAENMMDLRKEIKDCKEVADRFDSPSGFNPFLGTRFNKSFSGGFEK
jgi:hypothetical protein